MKKLCFILSLFVASTAFAQKTYIQCGQLIDGIANKAQPQMTTPIDNDKI